MNLKEDKDKILEMLTSKDLELRKLAVDYIKNNYDIDIIFPFFTGFIGYDDDFMVDNLINAIIEHNKL